MNTSNRRDTTTWLAAARDGDGLAWGCLLEYFRPYLTLLATAQLGRRLAVKADPADVVQEALLQAHRKFSDFRGGTAEEFAAWLEAVLASRVAKLIRRYYGAAARDLRLERELEADMAASSRQIGGLTAAGDSPSTGAAGREQAARVAAAVERLTSDQRRAIVGRHVEGLTFAQLGDELGRSADAATQLWARAVRRLRDLLEEGP